MSSPSYNWQSEVVVAYSDPGDLRRLRQTAESFALEQGMARERAAQLAVVVSELASNTLRHTTEPGKLRVWAAGKNVIAEVSDNGALPGAVATSMPPPTAVGGFGLALAAKLSDSIQIQADPVRIRVTFQL